MNEPDNPKSDELGNDFKDVISIVRQVQPRLESRIRNRNVIAEELTRIGSQPQAQPWWTRSVRVPVPVALAACMILLVSMIGWLFSWPGVANKTTGQPPVKISKSTNNTFNRSPATIEDSPLEYYATETYLCGIGRIEYASIYKIREN